MKTGDTKKLVAIDRLMRWAYRDELPKEQARNRAFLRPQGFAEPWGAVTKTGMLGTEISEPDIRNRFGLVPDLTATLEPHPDAVLVFDAVQDLAGLEVDLPEDWYPLADLGDLEALGRAAMARALAATFVKSPDGKVYSRETSNAQYLVHFHAIMGKAPDWSFPKPELKTVRHQNGSQKWFVREVQDIRGENMEVESDGFDRVKRRPKDGAFLKRYLDPDPVEAGIDRIKYRIWHSALGILAEMLAGRLDDHEPVDVDLPAEPWDPDQSRPAPRILKDLRVQQPTIGAGRPPRAKRRQSAA